MLDEQIYKAVECCVLQNCNECPYDGTNCSGIMKDVLDFINRLKTQNKEFDEKIIMQNGLIEYQRDKIAALTEIIEKGDFVSYSACRAIEDRKRKNAEYINELKAEIEGLEKSLKKCEDSGKYWESKYKNARSEVIKKVFKKLDDKSIVCKVKLYGKGKFLPCLSAVTLHDINKFKKEIMDEE